MSSLTSRENMITRHLHARGTLRMGWGEGFNVWIKANCESFCVIYRSPFGNGRAFGFLKKAPGYRLLGTPRKEEFLPRYFYKCLPLGLSQPLYINHFTLNTQPTQPPPPLLPCPHQCGSLYTSQGPSPCHPFPQPGICQGKSFWAHPASSPALCRNHCVVVSSLPHIHTTVHLFSTYSEGLF